MNIYYELRMLKNKIPKNTYKTILGQIKSGDVKGALKGINRLRSEIKDRRMWNRYGMNNMKEAVEKTI